ncbi:hypothetical protein [Peribacillus simplex]|uniref:hypothetical protein n=1 Tax=Peribacillus simplex TaxID=1478 RepID=UPI0033379A1D
MLGIMITDIIDSLIVYRMINQTNKLGQSASRVMGWGIVVLAYGVSFYQAFSFFNPWAELDFEILGVVLFLSLTFSFVLLSVRFRGKNIEINKN